MQWHNFSPTKMNFDLVGYNHIFKMGNSAICFSLVRSFHALRRFYSETKGVDILTP